MRTKKRSTEQLKKTSHWRHEVFEFMRQFNGRHMWTIDGPPDTEVDEMFCFAYSVDDGAGGVAIVQTWLVGGWSIYTEPSNHQELDKLARAIEAQAIERKGEGQLTSVYMRSRAAIALMLALKGTLVVIDEELAIVHGQRFPDEGDKAELVKLSQNAHKAISYAEGLVGEIVNIDHIYLVDAPLHLSKATKAQIEARKLSITDLTDVTDEAAGD